MWETNSQALGDMFWDNGVPQSEVGTAILKSLQDFYNSLDNWKSYWELFLLLDCWSAKHLDTHFIIKLKGLNELMNSEFFRMVLYKWIYTQAESIALVNCFLWYLLKLRKSFRGVLVKSQHVFAFPRKNACCSEWLLALHVKFRHLSCRFLSVSFLFNIHVEPNHKWSRNSTSTDHSLAILPTPSDTT